MWRLDVTGVAVDPPADLIASSGPKIMQSFDISLIGIKEIWLDLPVKLIVLGGNFQVKLNVFYTIR